MNLHEWEIWHTYTTYLKGGVKDLDSVAREFVRSGLALCAMHRDGATYWLSGGEVRVGQTIVEPDQEGSTANVKIDPSDGGELDLEGYALEAWYQSAYMRFGEIRLFGTDLTAPPPYIRAFLGEYTLFSEGGERPCQIACYPIIKLYESGILILELRIISPEEPVTLEEFVGDFVNIHTWVFDAIEVSPALAKLAPRAYVNYTNRKLSLLNRIRLRRIEEGHDKVIEDLTEEVEGGDFTFKGAPLPSTAEGKAEPLISLIHTIFGVIAFVASRPREGRGLLFLGQRPLVERGNFWEGRPHIHVVRHDNQMAIPAENEERHRESFGWVMSRTPKARPAVSAGFLPPNTRLFGDYAAYVARQATLWVWSKNGLEAQGALDDANRGHLIYEQQATAEMLEYGYMLHRSLAESVGDITNTGEVFRLRRELSELKGRMRRSSHFGEVADLLDRGWESMGVPALREEITESLAISEAETQAAEANAAEKFGRVLTIVFGMLAVPPIANEVIQPLWDLFSLWRPNNPAAAKLFMISVALAFVSLATYALLRAFSKGSERRGGKQS